MEVRAEWVSDGSLEMALSVYRHMGGPHNIIERMPGSSQTQGKHITHVSSKIHASEQEDRELSGNAGMRVNKDADDEITQGNAWFSRNVF